MSAADENSPLLGQPDQSNQREEVSESAPLLGDNQDQTNEGNQNGIERRRSSAWVLWPPFTQSTSKPSRKLRWPSIFAGIVLAVLVIVALVLGFLLPGAVKQYAEQAAVIEPTSLSVESITADGVRARIQANFRLDGSRVDDANARRLGRFATGIMRELGTEETELTVHLPGYGNSLLGSARIPPLTISIVDGHNTAMDFVTDLIPGDAEHIRKIANDWLEGKLDQIKVTGSAAIQLKSGIFPLGTHDVVESMVFEAKQVPSVPEYKIERLDFHEVPLGPDGRQAVGAEVTLSMYNEYPVSFDVPPLSFDILLANCRSSDPYIAVAEAVTHPIEIRSHANVSARALGIIREIPKSLIRSCPKTKSSPLDQFMNNYLHGEDAEVLVRGRDMKDSDTPDWITSILKSITVPIELPGRSFGDMIRNFSAEHVDFKLPSPFADPNDPESSPRVSGTIQVLAALPEELNLDLGVKGIKSEAQLYYDDRKLGELNLKRWHDANSTRITGDDEALLNITSRIVDVPLDITDEDVFSEVLQKMLFGDGDVVLDVKATVDVKVGTVLGNLAVKGVPAKGKIPVKRSSWLG
jgi:hypothetical protein